MSIESNGPSLADFFKAGQAASPEALAAAPIVEAPAPAVAPVAPAQSGLGGLSKEALEQLISLLLMREAKNLQSQDELEKAAQRKAEQRAKNAASKSANLLTRQNRCSHLKGRNKGAAKGGIKDYAVYLHTYINAERMIRCIICGMKWREKDTREKLYRFGKYIPNHTNLGWTEAVEMFEQSTNRASSSEIPGSVLRQLASPEKTIKELE